MGYKARRKGALRRRLHRNPADRPWDIIDEILANVGKIRTKAQAKPGEEGYYGEGYRAANYGAGRECFGPHGQSPDSAVDALRRAGALGNDATQRALGAAGCVVANQRQSGNQGNSDC